MDFLKRLRRTGAFLLACVVFMLFLSAAYVQGNGNMGEAAVQEKVESLTELQDGKRDLGEAGVLEGLERREAAEAQNISEAKGIPEAQEGPGMQDAPAAQQDTEMPGTSEVQDALPGEENDSGAQNGLPGEEKDSGAQNGLPGGQEDSEVQKGLEAQEDSDPREGMESQETWAEVQDGTEAQETPESQNESKVPEGPETQEESGAQEDSGTQEGMESLEMQETWAEVQDGLKAQETPETQNEPEAQADPEPQNEPEVPDGSEAQADSEIQGESETQEESELPVEEESEQMTDEITEEGELQQFDAFGLAPGESATIYVSPAQDNGIMTASTMAVRVTRAREPFWYADYGFGTRFTYMYTVTFNGITSMAYCIRPSLDSPDSSDSYTVQKIKGARMLAKVCYYGTKAAGDEGFFAENYPKMTSPERFIITHIAAAYANGSPDTFDGTNSRAQELAMELYNYCAGQPEIPEVDMEFSKAKVTAYADGDRQRTEKVTFEAHPLQSVTFKLPKGVQLHNVTTGDTSRAGAEVTISGGTKFYLSAPIRQAVDVAPSWSAHMKGSVTKDYSAYRILTGSTTQDLALVFGEGVEGEKYIDFSVKWLEQAEVEVVKADSRTGKNLAGAVFGVYAEPECRTLLAQMPATDAKGKASVKLDAVRKTVYLKELTPPPGYLAGMEVYPVTIASGKKSSQTVPNTEKHGSLTIYKEGEVLTGASVTDEGTVFQYERRRLAGAVYSVYAETDIVSAGGDTVYPAGSLVAGDLVTGADGTTALDGLCFGNYRVTEVHAPANYCNGQESRVVQVSADGEHPTAAFETGFFNERQKAEVSVLKQDAKTGNPLSGAVFGLFADADIMNADGAAVAVKDTLLGKAVSGADGSAKFAADIPVGVCCYVKELRAPEKYVLNGDDVFRFSFAYAGEDQAQVSFSHVFADERIAARIRLVKKDAQNGTAQGDATLEHAVYGLYAREDIVHPDGRSGTVFRRGEQVASLITDAEGKASAEDLYLGNYYIREISPSRGYLLDEQEYEISCTSSDGQTAVVEAECVSSETVIRQPFQIIKIAENGRTEADVLEGAGFSAYLASSLPVNADGTYDFSAAVPVVIGEGGATELFTDENGYAVSIPLPFGTYVVRETTVPKGYAPAENFEVRISENNPLKPQAWRVIRDEVFSAKLKIIKSDDETQKNVLRENTEFRVYDMDSGSYVEQVTTYPTEVKHTSYRTDEEGYLILPQSLSMGSYRIEEVSAPDGYTVGEGVTEVEVSGNAAYRMDDFSGDVIIETVASNHPVKGELRLVKKGETLQDYKDDFIYKEAPLAGAVYEVYAAEDIFTPDFQRDSEGKRILEYPQDALVAELVTDESGEAVLRDLPLGLYRVAEKTAPDGFVREEETQRVRFAYVDQDTPVVVETLECVDKRQRAEIIVIKRDAEDGGVLPGARFGLYAGEDITVGKETIAEADTLLATAVSDEKGRAVFEKDLPFGSYYVRELEAPEGFLLSEKTAELSFSYEGQDTDTVQLKAVFENEPTVVEFTKSDLTTGTELDSAVLSVIDQEGNVVDSWTSVKGRPHIIRELHVGETYVLREEMAPYGYLRAEEVEFTVEDMAAAQKVEMKDEVPVGRIMISKTGEFAESVSWGELTFGIIESVFEYLWGALGQVTFEVYAAEDIRAADGVSADHLKKDELAATITTDALGYAQTGDLPLGKYYIVEKETAQGFVLDGERREVDLTYRDQDTPLVTYDEKWQNRRQKALITVLKKEKGTERALPGAVFALCAGEDIRTAAGKVLIAADTVIEQKASGEDGKVVFAADLPTGGAYYVKEVQAPEGFVETEERRDFIFTCEDGEAETIPFEYVFENEATRTVFTKTDITTGNEIPGAKLCLTDREGNIVDEWVSEKEPHMICELKAGEEYTLREESAPKGYLTAEEITFRVGNTGNIQLVEMKDECAQGRIVIHKTDRETGEALKGAEFEVLDEAGKLLETLVTDKNGEAESGLYPIAVFEDGEYKQELTYTVKEVQAPDGYLTEETEQEVVFEWEDGGIPVIEYLLEAENEKVPPEPAEEPEKPEESEKTKEPEKPEKPKKPEKPAAAEESPRTGDETDIAGTLLVMAASGSILAGTALCRKKKVQKKARKKSPKEENK